jgi:hypothetical protein
VPILGEDDPPAFADDGKPLVITCARWEMIVMYLHVSAGVSVRMLSEMASSIRPFCAMPMSVQGFGNRRHN